MAARSNVYMLFGILLIFQSNGCLDDPPLHHTTLLNLISILGWSEVCEHWRHVFRAGGCQLQRRTVPVEVE